MPGTNSSQTPGRAERPHRGAGAGPVVEVAGDPDTAGVRRPHRERRSADRSAGRVVGPDVGAEDVPEVLVPALADQVQVDVAEGGQPAVGVVDLVDRAGAVVDPHPVVADRTVDDGREDAAVGVHERDLVAVLQQRDALRVVPQGADHRGAVALRVCTENAVRVVGVAADQLLVVVRAGPGWRGGRPVPARRQPRRRVVPDRPRAPRRARPAPTGSRRRPVPSPGSWPERAWRRASPVHRPPRALGAAAAFGLAAARVRAGFAGAPSAAAAAGLRDLAGFFGSSAPEDGSDGVVVVTRYLRC